MAGIAQPLAAVLKRRVAGCRDLIAYERLSAGASQETYRLVIRTDAGERKLAMRRAPAATSGQGGYAGLPTEALLMSAARRNTLGQYNPRNVTFSSGST